MKEIQNMLKFRTICESKSPFTAFIAIVKKKNAMNPICVRYWKLNKLTVADPQAMAALAIAKKQILLHD